MRINRIVVNASPVICLLKSELLYLLPKLFSEIVVPDKVYQEITAKSGIDISSLQHLKKASDIIVPQTVIAWDIGEGESSVLAFAQKNPDCWAVIDDREAKKIIGTLPILLLCSSMPERHSVTNENRHFSSCAKYAELLVYSALNEKYPKCTIDEVIDKSKELLKLWFFRKS